MKAYYHARAREYDYWWHRIRANHGAEVDALEHTIAAIPPALTLDVACGTGFLTRHLRGDVVALDQSESMVQLTREQAPNATVVQGEALELPFEDGSFDRVFTGHFYGHLFEDERLRFLAEARRVATELVVVDSARHPDAPPDGMQERELLDGSRWEVYKRYFTPEGLLEELGGGRVLHAGRCFVAVAA